LPLLLSLLAAKKLKLQHLWQLLLLQQLWLQWLRLPKTQLLLLLAQLLVPLVP
jgi:hypothetical protein